MREKIEWAEPIEVVRERRERINGEVRQLGRFLLRCALLLPLPVLIALPTLGVEPEQVLESSLLVLVPTLGCWATVGAAMRLEPRPRERTCSLGTNDKLLWKHARSFEITDHPTLRSIRSFSLHTQKLRLMAQFCFRHGQLDETELRAFIQSRIAAPIAQRLMKRVRM